MASALPDFVLHCVELLAPTGAVRINRMFGGYGLYVDEVFIAVISRERLYLKTAPETRTRLEAEGCEPFRYSKDGEEVSLSYWSAPADAMESPALMLPWARLALQAALAARAAKAPVRPRAAKVKTTTTRATSRGAPAAKRSGRG
jgi:DNA transformation protein